MESLDHLVGGLTSELDTRLADGRRPARGALPRRAGGTPARAHGVRPGRPLPRRASSSDHGAAALAATRRARGPAARPRRRRPRPRRPGAREARPRARRGPAHRLRGRLRHPLRRGGGRRRRRAAAGLRAALDAGSRGAVHRHPVQGLRGADPQPRPAHPRRSSWPGSSRTARCRTASSSRCPRSPRSSRSRPWSTSPRGSRPAGPRRRRRCASRSRSRRRSRSSAPTARPSWPGWSTPPAAAAPACTTAPTTTRAFCGIAAAHQSLEHPVADHAKAVMQAAAAGTGVRLSDGSTNVLPVGDAGRGRGRVGQPPAAGPPLAGARLLPGLGPPPGPAADALRGDVRVLPRRARGRRGPAAHLRRAPGLRRPRRAGDRTRARRLPAARDRLRRPVADRGRPRRPGWTDAGSPGWRTAPRRQEAVADEHARGHGDRAGTEPLRQGGDRASYGSCATPRATRSATSTCRRRCTATSPPRTPTATSRRCCPPTPRRTPRSPSPRSTASPRPRTTRSRSARRLLEATPAADGARGAGRGVRLGPDPGRRRRPRPRVRAPRRRGAHHGGRRDGDGPVGQSPGSRTWWC